MNLDLSPDDQSRHTLIRKLARDATYKAAASMANYYNRKKCGKSPGLAVGDRVTVCVPTLDRSTTDHSRIPCVITAVHGDKVKSHSLSTQFGCLKNKFRRGDLEGYSGMVNAIHDQTISLREAAKKFHPENKFTKSHCNCTSGCKNDRCSCRQNHIYCSTHCHQSRTCGNCPKPSPTVVLIKSPSSSSTASASKSSCSSRTIIVQKSSTSTVAAIGRLTTCDRGALHTKTWLNDRHMDVANQLLRVVHPSVDGLEDTILQEDRAFTVPSSE